MVICKQLCFWIEAFPNTLCGSETYKAFSENQAAEIFQLFNTIQDHIQELVQVAEVSHVILIRCSDLKWNPILTISYV